MKKSKINDGNLEALNIAIQNTSKDLNNLVDQKERFLQEKYFPILKEKYEGKFFVIENGFGGNDPKWRCYQKVLPFTPEDVYTVGKYDTVPTARIKVLRFQMIPDRNGRIISYCIDQEENTYIHSLGKEISYNAFVKAWNELIDAISTSW